MPVTLVLTAIAVGLLFQLWLSHRRLMRATLPRPRPDRLRSVSSILEAECGAVAGEIDRLLDHRTWLDGDRIGRTG